MELPDLHAARMEAVARIGTLLGKESGAFWNSNDWHMNVVDEHSLSQFVLYFMSGGGLDTGRGPEPLV